MIIDDYAYKNKLFKVNPNIKFSVGMLFLIISLISPYNILSVLIILGMSITIVGIAKNRGKRLYTFYKNTICIFINKYNYDFNKLFSW